MGLFFTVHEAFHEPATRVYRVVEGLIWALIVLSVVLLAAEPFLLDNAGDAPGWWMFIDKVLLAIFAVEVSLRILSYRPLDLEVFARPPLGAVRTHVVSRLRFALQPSNIVDIVTVLSFVPALRGLRAFRLLRLLRSVRVFRYANPFEGVMFAIERDRLLFTLAFSVLGVEVIVGGASIFLVERLENPGINSFADGIWWALVTITTVGFGDITAVTSLGRVVAGFLMVKGMFTLAFFAGIVGHSLLNTVLSVREEQFRMSGYVNHIVVCGYTEGARLLLDGLAEELDLEKTKTVLFANHTRPHSLPPQFLWVEGDPSKESELDKARLSHARAVLLVADRSLPVQSVDATTILTAFTIRSYLARQESAKLRKQPVYVLAEILDPENVEHAQTAGVDEIVQTTRVGYDLLTHAVTNPGTGGVVSQIALHGEANFYVGQVPGSLDLPLSYGEISTSVREQTGALVIGFRGQSDAGERVNPPDETMVQPGSHLIYLAEAAVLKSPS
ncbi:MAG: ion transporter [Deltaproteobacteria bacterium]|nr:ion transporter [Deltaproteobacteria bacterium]